MSKPFLWSVIAVLSIALAFFIWLHYKELNVIDQALGIKRMECVSVPYKVGQRPKCVLA